MFLVRLMPSKVYLGPNLTYWCNFCNIPILELKNCPVCESPLKKLDITPPYEMSPAFEKDLILIRGIIDNQYGNGVGIQLIPENKIVLLNKAPYYDRMDEIIVDGFVLGNIRFNPAILQWEFIPKLEGARRLAELSSRKWIEIDDGAIDHIAQSANVLAPGVVEFDSEFQANDYLIILTSNKQAIGTGVAKYSAADLKNVKTGMVVKTKEHDFPNNPEIRLGGQKWESVLAANTGIIEKREKEAKNFIIKTVKKFPNLPISVSFSGGKDSLCLLSLVLDAIGPTDVFFIDTGIEFEETINFIKEIIEDFNLTERFTYKASNESFWNNLEKFGPPAKDYRWCCKVIKLANITSFFNEKYPEKKVITFVGSRQYESASRSQDKKIWINSFLPQQINVSPIHKWPSLYVWIYLLSKKLKINPIYFEGYKRIGCIYCPATKLSELQQLNELHPDLYTRWMKFLREWGEKYNLSPEWAERGFWRWRKFKEKGQIHLASEMGISEEKIIWQKDYELKFYLTQGINPCQDGSFSIEGRIEGYLDINAIMNQLGIVGSVKYSESLGIINLRSADLSLNLFSDGTIILRGVKDEIEENLKLILSLIKRAHECIGCGLCISQCTKQALTIKADRIWVNHQLCDHCQMCLEKCSIIKYA